METWRRYRIETKPTRDLVPHPNRFHVDVKRHRLAWMLAREFVHYRGNLPVLLSRPCMYGVFGSPVGGFMPRPHLCVGCLRCTTEFPDVVQIYRNPAREKLGDAYITPDNVDTIHYESQTGRVPVRGAGYRGPFGGEGWDGMWTDMSEIVRPTRDGIHGREFISSVVDLGGKPALLTFDRDENYPRVLSIPIPVLFDIPPASLNTSTLPQILADAARETETLAILPLDAIARFNLTGTHLVPLINADQRETLSNLSFEPRMIEIANWDAALDTHLRERFPTSVIALRLPFDAQLHGRILDAYRTGERVFHLTANYHGRDAAGRFVLDRIREIHVALVKDRVRDQVTLIGSGGIVAAEHVPKAIICGLDAIALDTALLAALQAQFVGDCADRATGQFTLPKNLSVEWGVQRVKNLLGSWRDQLLEVLGAMGLREVRRLRGEVGRAMFQNDLEREAFAEIEGYG